MQWLTLAYFLSLGTMAYQTQTFDPRGSAMFIVPQNSFQTTLGVEAQAFDNHAFAGASVETLESYNGNLFSPSEAFYVFNAGLRAWGFELDGVTSAIMPLVRRGEVGFLKELWPIGTNSISVSLERSKYSEKEAPGVSRGQGQGGRSL